MIDIHSHIVFDIDDGSKSMEESIAILRRANERGIHGMFATPHFMEGMYANKDEVLSKIDVLKEKLRDENINMQIYPGHELYIDDNAVQLLNDGKVLTLNNSRYVLVEFPFMTQLVNLESILFDLTLKNYVPIIAHAERYIYVQKDINVAKAWIERGYLLQLNLPTFYGKYGSEAKKTAIKMLKRNMFHFVGTDVHAYNSTALSVASPLKQIREIVDLDVYKDITINNAIRVANDKEIVPFEIKESKFSILDMIRNRIG